MICLFMVTYLNLQEVKVEPLHHCYGSYEECRSDAPRVAHQIVPAEGRVYGFRCAAIERP